MMRTPGQIYCDIQDAEAEILLAAFQGYDAEVAIHTLKQLTAEMKASTARVVFEEMNRDPGKFYPMETCALAVQFAEALIKAGVIPAPQKEEK